MRPIVIYALIVIAILLPIIFIVNQRPDQSEAGWYDQKWTYRQRVPITNSGSAQTDYQIPITLDTAALITNRKMKPGCEDIRVVGEDGKILPHYIDKSSGIGCNATTTKLWTKIPSIPTSGVNVYIYYGNPSATQSESGKNTFMYFDDFSGTSIDTALWTVSDPSAQITQSAGKLRFTTGSSAWNQMIWLTPSIARGDVTFETDLKWTSGNAGADHLMVGWKDNTAGAHYSDLVYASYVNSPDACTTCALIIYEDGTSRGSTAYNYVLNTNYKERIRMRASGGAYYDLSSDGGSSFTTTYTSVYSTESSLHPAWSFYAGTYEMDNFFVYKNAATPPAVGTLASEEAGKGPVAHYRFDEGAGTTVDNSAGGIGGYLSSQGTSLGSSTSYTTGPTDAYMVTTGDLNMDGIPDLVVSNTSSTYTTSVLLGDGDGTFGTKSDYSPSPYSGVSPIGVSVKDMNADGYQDVVTIFNVNNLATILYGNGAGGFTTLGGFSTGSGARRGVFEDINKDGLIDMIFSSTAGGIDVRLATGTSSYQSIVTYTYSGSITFDIEGGDFNNDGYIDIASVENNSGRVGVWINNRDGTFASIATYGNLAGADGFRSITVGDINSDGYTDIVAGAVTGPKYQVFLNDGDGTFTYSTAVTISGAIDLSSVTLAEINGDGYPDLYMHGRSASTVAVDKIFINNADGTFTDTTSFSSGVSCSACEGISNISDLDGDGKNDIVVPNMSGTDEVLVYLNTRTTSSWQAEDQCISGGCIRFDGTDDGVTVPSSFGKPNSLTTSMWIRTDSTAYTPLMGQTNTAYPKNPTSYVAALVMLANGKIRAEYWTGTIGAIESPTALNDNKWHHISFVGSGTNQTLYIDGVDVGSRSGTISQSWWTNTSIGSGFIDDDRGAASDTWAYFDGVIDEFKIYPYAQTADEVKADYIQGSGSAGSSGSQASFGDEGEKSLTDGLIGHWKMDETAADTCTGGTNDSCDSSGTDNDASWGGNATATATGKYGYGITLDGAADHVNVPDNDIYSVTNTNQLTVSGWFYLDSIASRRSIFSKGSSGQYEWDIRSETDGTLNAILYNTDSVGYMTAGSPASTIAISRWYHAVLVADLTKPEIRLYIDGKLIAISNATTGTHASGTAAVRFGERADGSNDVDGMIDEVRIYNRTLSEREVSQLYRWSPGSAVYYNFNENTGSVVYDTGESGGSALLGIGSSSPDWGPGRYGGGLTFDGSNDHVTISEATHINNFSFGGWFRATATHEIDTEASTGITGTSGQKYAIWPVSGLDNSVAGVSIGTNGISVYEHGNSYMPAIAVYNATIGSDWNHIFIVYENKTPSIYLNGAKVHTGLTSPRATVYSPYSAIGGGAYGYFSGGIDEVRIYNYSRTQKQIVEDMNASHPSVGSPVASPVGHYKFDEGYSTTLNNAGSGGTSINGVLGVGTSAPSWSNEGIFGRALNFDGTNDRVTVPHNASINLTTFTVTAWFKWESEHPSELYRAIVAKANGNGNGLQDNFLVYVVDATGKLGARTGDGTNLPTLASEGPVVNDSAWHHAAYIYDSSTGYSALYQDGTLVDSNTGGGTAYTTSQDMDIGGWDIGSTVYGEWDGLIDEVKVYSYMLTADEIKADYNFSKAATLGSIGTTSAGLADNSSSREYCMRGDSTTCNSPVLEWTLNEGTGTSAYDTASNTSHGTLGVGGSAPYWSPGIIGRGLGFDGVDDYVDFGDVAAADFGTSDFTISGWVKTTTTASRYFISKRASCSHSNFWNLIALSTGILQLELDEAGGVNYNTVNSTSVINDGKWHHFTFVRVGATVYGYIDGKLEVTDTGPGTANLSNSNSLQFAENPCTGAGSAFPGLLDNIRIYNYARTSAQVAWEYSKGAPIAHYKMDECEGTTIYNSAPTYNDTAPGTNGTLSIGATGSNTAAGTCSTTGAWAAGASGKYNSSMSFDGTDDNLNLGVIGLGSELNGSPSVTLSAWVNVDSYPASNSGRILIIWEANGSIAAGLSTVTTGFHVTGKSANADTAQAITCVTSTTNTWKHLVGVIDYANDTVKYYIDGQICGELAATFANTSFTLGAPTNQDTIGSQNGTANFFDGEIDEVKVFNYGLTETQIKTEYNKGAVRFD